MRDLPSHLAIIGGAAAIAAGVVSGWTSGLIVALIGLGILASTWVGRRIATDVDRAWLTALLPLAFIAKMIGSAVRYFVVAEVYGIGDAFDYHQTGLRIAPIWESLQVPEVTGGSFGTQVTGQITGLVYAIVSPRFSTNIDGSVFGKPPAFCAPAKAESKASPRPCETPLCATWQPLHSNSCPGRTCNQFWCLAVMRRPLASSTLTANATFAGTFTMTEPSGSTIVIPRLSFMPCCVLRPNAVFGISMLRVSSSGSDTALTNLRKRAGLWSAVVCPGSANASILATATPSKS